MQMNIQSVFRLRRVCFSNYAIWFSICIGLFLGTYCGVIADASIFSLMRHTVFCRMSIVCLIASQLLPFLIAAYAAFISNRILLLSVCAGKMFLFGFVGYLVFAAFGSAGWLIRFLFLFSDVFLVPILCYFCLRIDRKMASVGRELIIAGCHVIAIVILDTYFFSDILEKLIYS